MNSLTGSSPRYLSSTGALATCDGCREGGQGLYNPLTATLISPGIKPGHSLETAHLLPRSDLKMDDILQKLASIQEQVLELQRAMKHGNMDTQFKVPNMLGKGPGTDNPTEIGENVARSQSLGVVESQNQGCSTGDPWMGFPESQASPKLDNRPQPRPEPTPANLEETYAKFFGLPVEDMGPFESEFLAGSGPVSPSSGEGGQVHDDVSINS
ncbi:hypothetical protein B0J18DRAFT_455866, partial [Chaetomium sp. MPI-SDFR-AT-0129]